MTHELDNDRLGDISNYDAVAMRLNVGRATPDMITLYCAAYTCTMCILTAFKYTIFHLGNIAFERIENSVIS